MVSLLYSSGSSGKLLFTMDACKYCTQRYFWRRDADVSHRKLEKLVQTIGCCKICARQTTTGCRHVRVESATNDKMHQGQCEKNDCASVIGMIFLLCSYHHYINLQIVHSTMNLIWTNAVTTPYFFPCYTPIYHYTNLNTGSCLWTWKPEKGK